MGQSIIACAAATPTILFLYLWFLCCMQQKSGYRVNAQPIPIRSIRIEQLFEEHFERLIAVELQGINFRLSAYINARSNGIYQLQSIKGEMILCLRKTNSGWVVLEKGRLIDTPLQFLTPFILLLEEKFYN